jgi:hypothetical protein
MHTLVAMGWEAQPAPIQWVPSQGIKWSGREADRSPPAGDESKYRWICTSTPPYAFLV